MVFTTATLIELAWKDALEVEWERERDYTYLFHYIFLAKGQMNSNSAPEAAPKEAASELKHVR